MAATNFTPIQLYFSTTASAAPLAANLAQGELAININDGKLYYEDSTGAVQVIATKGAGTIGGSTTQIQYNNAGALAGNAAMVFNNSTNVTTLTTLNLTNALGAIYGGTAQSTYTQGDVLYSSAANTLAKLSIGATNYILTSTGSIPQWVAPSSIAVLTATNLAGGLAGSVPYQSALDTTTFLAIGAANRVMTSTGTAPQWVTSLTGLTGVSSSSITDTGLTSGRVTFASTSGLLADSANLTFNGTTLTTTGLSNSGFSTLVKTLTFGDTSFNGTAVFAAATPAKLYMGTGTVTDVTSAISATNTTGAIASLAITPIAATNTGVTYTNASTLYIAGAPSAGTNITITNPYSLYVAAGASYFGGGVIGTIGATGATTGAFTSLTASTTLGVTGVSTLTAGAVIQGLTVGRGAGAVSTNTAVGASALAANISGNQNTAIGYVAGAFTTGTDNTALGYGAYVATSGSNNTGVGSTALIANTSGSLNTAIGQGALSVNISGAENTAAGAGTLVNNTGSYNSGFGRYALASNVGSGNSSAVGYQAGFLSTGIGNQFFGYSSGSAVTTGAKNVILGSYTGSAAPISATGSNYIILSDGDGVVRQVINSSGNVGIGLAPAGAAKLEIKQALASQQGAWVYASANDSHARLFCDGTSVGLAASFTSTGSYLPMTFYTSAIERARISAAGDFTVSTGNLVIGTAGKGIDFSVTSSGSGTMTSELLADYEEGTWTPSLGGTTTYTAQQATYTKVGRAVYFTAYIIVNLIGTGSTTIITGLPFATSITSNFANSARAVLSATNIVSLAIIVAGTQITLLCRTAASTSDGTSAIAQNGSTIEVNGFYFV